MKKRLDFYTCFFRSPLNSLVNAPTRSRALGYIYEYGEEWSVKDPYTHYIIMVNYADLKEYKRYAILDQGELSFSDTLKEARGSAIPILVERAEETHPRTKEILREIESKKARAIEN